MIKSLANSTGTTIFCPFVTLSSSGNGKPTIAILRASVFGVFSKIVIVIDSGISCTWNKN